MNTKLIAAGLVFAALSTGCNRAPNISSDSPQVQAEPFDGQVYRALDGHSTLTLISPDECELNEGGTTLLCKYTKQPDALRVVATEKGTNQVIYYRFTDQGIQDNDGGVLLSPERYAQAAGQLRRQQDLMAQARHPQRTLLSERVLARDLVLSDVDLMDNTDAGETNTIWFGDIASLSYSHLNVGENADELTVYTRTGGQWMYFFPSEAAERNFQNHLAEAISDWKQRYPMLAK